jgi:hypothetical protein
MSFVSSDGTLFLKPPPHSLTVNNTSLQQKPTDDIVEKINNGIMKQLELLHNEINSIKETMKTNTQPEEKQTIISQEPLPNTVNTEKTANVLKQDFGSSSFFNSTENVQMTQTLIVVAIIVLILLIGFIIVQFVLAGKKLSKD